MIERIEKCKLSSMWGAIPPAFCRRSYTVREGIEFNDTYFGFYNNKRRWFISW